MTEKQRSGPGYQASPVDGDAMAVIHLNVPGWLKNEMLERANAEGISLRSWVMMACKAVVEGEVGVPPPPPARAPIPTVQEVVDDYMSGANGTMAPCGSMWPCAVDTEGTKKLVGTEYCNACGIRVK